MPVWHEKLKPARKRGDVVLLGVIQEQHPERCQLFAQWKQWDWPILHDPINQLSLDAVPVVVAIDEHGVVRDTRLQLDEAENFLQGSFAATKTPPKTAPRPSLDDLRAAAEAKQPTKSDLRHYADALLLWGGAPHDSRLSQAIKAYRQAGPDSASDWFRIGVAHRMRFESSARKIADFQSAVDAWSRALSLNPNQYIYRRRIQQYGPRLTKPYSFYDWVAEARQAIHQRGETPVELSVEPSGAEFAKPLRGLEQMVDDVPTAAPDPDNQIRRDLQGLVTVTTTLVPAAISPGGVARVHVELRVNDKAHWNNEVQPMKLWVDAPQGWKLSQKLLHGPATSSPESSEPRRFEFEVQAPTTAKTQTPTVIRGYALFHACQEANGTCLYLRKDFSFRMQIKKR